MIERILRGIIEKKFNVDELLVMTFTNSGTDEKKDGEGLDQGNGRRVRILT